MLQRPQTLFMLLTFTCLVLALAFPTFQHLTADGSALLLYPYTLKLEGSNVQRLTEVGQNTHNLLTALAVLYAVIVALLVFALISFKKRPLQIRLLAFNNVLIWTCLGLLAYAFSLVLGPEGSVLSGLHAGVVLLMAAPIFNLVAINRIRKDEALVRSMHRLR